MNFLNFLRESYKETKGHMVLQKIVDMVDKGHMEYDKTKMDINLGKLIKDSTLYDLHIIIRKAKENSVKLGKNKLNDEIAIVIDTNYYPQRQNIHKLFSREEVVNGFSSAFEKYMKKYHETVDHENKTHHETSKEVNTNKGFETNYKELNTKINDKIKEYKAALARLKSDFGNSALPSHKASYEAAVEHLKKDSIGTTAKEFTSKMMKLVDAKYMEHIDGENKKKLISRLTSYYEHNFI